MATNPAFMKKLIPILLLLIASAAYCQVQQGDKNVTFALSYTSFDGTGFGLFSGKFGYFVTQNVEAGIAPQFFFGQSLSAFGTGIYGTYNFLTADAKLLPYIGGAFSFMTGDIKSTAIGAYAGTKYFVTDSINIDGGLNFSANLGEVGGTIITFQLGVGFLIGRI
jgi:hypothetical protein